MRVLGCWEALAAAASQPLRPLNPACKLLHPCLLPCISAQQRYTDILKAMPLGLGLEAHPAGGGDDNGAGPAASNSSAAGAGGRRHRKRRCRLVESVEVSVTSSDQSLNLETRESYSLEVAAGAAMIQANSVYGALRGMETLAQLARRRELRCGGAADGGDASDGGQGDEGGDDEGGSGEAGCTAEGRLVPPDAVWPGE